MQPSRSNLNQTLLAVADAMFAPDDRGRLAGDAPHLYVLRTMEHVVWRGHTDLSPGVLDRLADLVERRPLGRPRAWAHSYADYINAFSTAGLLDVVRAGPLYTFPDLRAADGDAVRIGLENAELLRDGLDEWLPDVETSQPMMAVTLGDRAVSLCASVRASAIVHCAGVETIARHKGRALAAQAVAAWASAVSARGAVPFYGTTFDNLPSQRVASRLGLKVIASEFWLRFKR